MLILKALRFKAIGRFVDQQEIDLEQLGNLIQVDGINNNTGGSSGAAKSTIFNAIDFLFGLNTIANSLLQSRLTDDSILVEGDFDFDGQPLTISRGKKLKITLNGEVTIGSAKLAEEKLDQIIGIPRDLFRPMLHKKQGEKGFFLSFTPAEMNGFLTDCLGLTEYKAKLAVLDAKISEATKQAETTSAALGQAKSGLKATQDAIQALGTPPECEVAPDSLLKLQNELKEATNAYNVVSEGHKAREAAFVAQNSPKVDIVPFDSSALEKAELGIQEAYKQIGSLQQRLTANKSAFDKETDHLRIKQFELNAIAQKGKQARDEAIKLAGEVKKIRSSQCPRCEQSWITERAKEDEARTLEKIASLQLVIKDGEVAAQEAEKLTSNLANRLYQHDPQILNEITRLEEVQKTCQSLASEEKRKRNDHIATQNKTAKEKQDDFNTKLKALRDEGISETSALNAEVMRLKAAVISAETKLKAHLETKKRYETTLNTLTARETSYAEGVYSLEAELDELKLRLLTLEELKRAVKSYLSCSFDEALESISESATRMIQSIPNMQNATIQLSGTKETKDGKVKEEVNAIIHMDGEENIPIKTLSGGERASVDIAIDLAVLNLIEERTNRGFNLYLMDEPFTGLDSANIEMVLDILKSSHLNKKLLLTDHNPIVKEQISDRITVVRTGLQSTLSKD